MSIRDRETHLSHEREEEKRKSGEDDIKTREDIEEKAVVSNRFDLARLKEAAEKATPGERWAATSSEPDLSVLAEIDPWLVLVEAENHEWDDVEQARADAQFIALANPATILSLIDTLQAQAAGLERAREALAYGRDVAEQMPDHLRAAELNVFADILIEFVNRADRALGKGGGHG